MKYKTVERKINTRELFFVLLALFLPFQYGLALLERQFGSLVFLHLALAATGGLLLAVLYYSWYNNFGNLDFGQIFTKTFGRVFGKIILVFYALAFWAVIIDLSYTLSYVWSAMGNNQPLGILLIIVFLAAVMAISDKTVISRLANFVVFPALIFLLAGILISLSKGNIADISAVTSEHRFEVWFPAFYGFSMSFGLAVMVLPFLKDLIVTGGEIDFSKGRLKEKKVFKCLLFSVIVGAVFLLLLALRNIAVLGNSVNLYNLPFVRVLEMFSLGNGFGQSEVFGILLFEAVGITGLAFAFCAVNEVTCKIIPITSKGYLSIAWAAVTYLAAFVIFAQPDNMTEKLIGCTNCAVWIAAFVIPAFTLLVDKIGKH